MATTSSSDTQMRLTFEEAIARCDAMDKELNDLKLRSERMWERSMLISKQIREARATLGWLEGGMSKTNRKKFNIVLEELAYFHFLRKREREAMIGRNATILDWMKIVKKYSPLDSVW